MTMNRRITPTAIVITASNGTRAGLKGKTGPDIMADIGATLCDEFRLVPGMSEFFPVKALRYDDPKSAHPTHITRRAGPTYTTEGVDVTNLSRKAEKRLACMA